MNQQVITETLSWITKVVVGCNFCPFAAREVKRGSIHYEVVRTEQVAEILQSLSREFDRLDNDESIETTLIILPGQFLSFGSYLDMIDLCEEFLADQDYEGVYQIASFHPEYVFEGEEVDDPANYTNRSLYPMIHILRESSITNALENFDHPERIPQKNIEFARKKGLAQMQLLRESCFTIHH
jgi:uncharacterized protein